MTPEAARPGSAAECARPPLRFRLRDRNPAVVEAWRQHFAGSPDVSVSAGDIRPTRW